MIRLPSLTLAILAVGAIPTLAHDAGPFAKAPPAAPYQEVSKLVKLPEFLPGLGQLYVDPATLPAGPFLAYDHDGALVSTIFMIAFLLFFFCAISAARHIGRATISTPCELDRGRGNGACYASAIRPAAGRPLPAR